MPERLQRLNMIVLTIVIAYTLAINDLLSDNPIVSREFDSVITLLTSIGFYRLLLVAIYALVAGNKTLLKVYWGRQYLAGLWSYTYVKGAGDDETRYFGIWRFEQDLIRTRLVGFGLDEGFVQRSTVRSVTGLIESNGIYEVVNLRRDAVDPQRDYYSTTTMILDYTDSNILSRFPKRFRSQTIIYGGTLTGDLHRDDFIKHDNVKNEEEVIEELRRRYA